MNDTKHPVISAVTRGEKLKPLAPTSGTEAPGLPAQITPPNETLVKASAFREDTDPPLSMHDIAEALAAKRTEQRLKLKRLAELMREAADILNSFDA